MCVIEDLHGKWQGARYHDRGIRLRVYIAERRYIVEMEPRLTWTDFFTANAGGSDSGFVSRHKTKLQRLVSILGAARLEPCSRILGKTYDSVSYIFSRELPVTPLPRRGFCRYANSR